MAVVTISRAGGSSMSSPWTAKRSGRQVQICYEDLCGELSFAEANLFALQILGLTGYKGTVGWPGSARRRARSRRRRSRRRATRAADHFAAGLFSAAPRAARHFRASWRVRPILPVTPPSFALRMTKSPSTSTESRRAASIVYSTMISTVSSIGCRSLETKKGNDVFRGVGRERKGENLNRPGSRFSPDDRHAAVGSLPASRVVQ
jgi:hypothetical protein